MGKFRDPGIPEFRTDGTGSPSPRQLGDLYTKFPVKANLAESRQLCRFGDFGCFSRFAAPPNDSFRRLGGHSLEITRILFTLCPGVIRISFLMFLPSGWKLPPVRRAPK